ncbi:MAG: type IA DNA topoisomerase, partial [Deferrisomatales bacterium]|nr:type IA DNA topoisomerase [Deferrisomatales bacterium]
MNVLIVESRAKAKTIQKYLGKPWVVLATGGHVQELPTRREDPREGKKAYWASTQDALPSPPWAWTDNGEKAVRAILEAAGGARAVFHLATDPDREGEFIAWRLSELLASHGATPRVTFQEVTREAVTEALARPREIDMPLVDSARVRRFLDRLIGYRTSKLARGFVTASKASMGRVQTPALGFVVDRELEREAHVPVRYFEVTARVPDLELRVRFHEKADPARWVDEKGKFQGDRTSDRSLAEQAHRAIERAGALVVTSVQPGERVIPPKPAFTTDTLLQAAGSWGWSPKKTMKLASTLYEGGHITYLRTDSTRLSEGAVAEARDVITALWGTAQLGAGASAGKKTAARIQDAHEAIRPTRAAVEIPEGEGIDEDALRLYALIRAQLLASLMAPARQSRLQVTAAADGLDRPLTGSASWYAAPGWRLAFADLDREPVRSQPVEIAVGSRLALLPGGDPPNPHLREGETQPPARYRAHTLVKAMKDSGIGRPSTYASTVETLLDRKYVREEGGALVPTEDGRRVWLDVAPLYALSDGEPLFDVAYTAALEECLDGIAEGSEPAPPVWLTLRDAVRQAHEGAQAARRAGGQTPAQRARLEALLANAPLDLVDEVDASSLSWAETNDRIERLRAAGVLPAPSERQRAEIERLLAETGASREEAAALGGLEGWEELRYAAQASELIDALRERQGESRQPTARQLRYLSDLVGKLGLSEGEACARVGAADVSSLTGGGARGRPASSSPCS